MNDRIMRWLLLTPGTDELLRPFYRKLAESTDQSDWSRFPKPDPDRFVQNEIEPDSDSHDHDA